MGTVLEVLAAQPWIWWLMAMQVLAVVVLVAFGAGYVVGADRRMPEDGR